MSRRCRKCPTASLPDDVRHLHELEAGELFRFRSRPDRVYRLLRVGKLDCTVRGAEPTRARKREFRTRDGELVNFKAPGSQVQRVAPGAMVEPVQAGLPALFEDW